jgi:hypothetical protein
MIESAFSIIVAGLLGYLHALYAWVIGLSVLTAAFLLVSHKVLPRISLNACFLAVHFAVYFVVAWLH